VGWGPGRIGVGRDGPRHRHLRSSFRELPAAVVEEITKVPERRPNQRVVDLTLRDGRVVEKVWIAWDRYPALIGGKTILGRYRPKQVAGARAHD
jgi:hypothetical protein